MASSPIVISRRQNLWGRTIAQVSRDLGAWLYLAAVLALVSVLAFVYLLEASYVARQINIMVDLEEELDKLHQENSELLLGIADFEEMSRIKREATAMGLAPAKNIEYIEVVLDDISPVAPGNSPQSSPTGGVNGGQRSGSAENNGLVSMGGLRFESAIVQQFQGWIGRGTAAGR